MNFSGLSTHGQSHPWDWPVGCRSTTRSCGSTLLRLRLVLVGSLLDCLPILVGEVDGLAPDAATADSTRHGLVGRTDAPRGGGIVHRSGCRDAHAPSHGNGVLVGPQVGELPPGPGLALDQTLDPCLGPLSGRVLFAVSDDGNDDLGCRQGTNIIGNRCDGATDGVQ